MMLAGAQNAERSFMSEAEDSDCKSVEPRRLSFAFESSEDDSLRKRVLAYTSPKPTQKKMVLEAIRIIGSAENKGASIPAISKWIIGNYAILDIDRAKLFIKREILKELEKGTIERSSTSRCARGATGSFILSQKKQNKRPSVGQKAKIAKSTPSKKKEESNS